LKNLYKYYISILLYIFQHLYKYYINIKKLLKLETFENLINTLITFERLKDYISIYESLLYR